MPLPPSLVIILREPSAAAVWELRAELLASGLSPGARIFELLAEFHRFLDHLETGAASRDHSERASLMDIGSFGAVVAADLLEAEESPDLARRLLAGALTEGLAVLATRQHVKAWRGELASVFRDAAWALALGRRAQAGARPGRTRQTDQSAPRACPRRAHRALPECPSRVFALRAADRRGRG
jgi:hypothetical protein